MERLRTTLFWTIVLSESTHIFCCVLPTAISIFSLLAGMGLMSMLPAGFLHFHDVMHDWEIPLIAFSSAMLALGWILHYISIRIDCHDTGCAHGPCKPKKISTAAVLKIATGMFLFNTVFYVLFHSSIAPFA